MANFKSVNGGANFSKVGFSMLGDIGGGGLVNSWYSLATFQIYENKQIPEGEQINEP